MNRIGLHLQLLNFTMKQEKNYTFYNFNDEVIAIRNEKS